MSFINQFNKKIITKEAFHIMTSFLPTSIDMDDIHLIDDAISISVYWHDVIIRQWKTECQNMVECYFEKDDYYLLNEDEVGIIMKYWISPK